MSSTPTDGHSGDNPNLYWQQQYRDAQRRGLQGWGNSLIDRQIDKHVAPRIGKRTLEVGGSSGEHFAASDRHAHDEVYVALDLMPGATDPDVARSVLNLPGFFFLTGDVESLPFCSGTFDQVVSTCLLAHVGHPEVALTEIRRVTREGGSIVLGLPCDPGMLNRLVKVIVTYRSMRNAGVDDPRLSYAREHRNGISNLLTLIAHVFRNDRVRFYFFPFGVRSWNLNLAVTVVIAKSNS